MHKNDKYQISDNFRLGREEITIKEEYTGTLNSVDIISFIKLEGSTKVLTFLIVYMFHNKILKVIKMLERVSQSRVLLTVSKMKNGKKN